MFTKTIAMKKMTSLFLAAFSLPLLMNAQPNIALQTFASGLARPTDIAHCGDSRLFIVEQKGLIQILDESGNKLPQPFLNIQSQVGSTQNEQGLLGLAFHPDYGQNGYFFINYTDNNGDTRVSRMSVKTDNPNQADPASEKILLEVAQPFSNHNGGCMKFGPDGYLYFSLGDGGSGGDPYQNGQNRLVYLAKIHRIDVDNGDPYAIPPDNPFANDSDALGETWAYGLRNPWRFSFDRTAGDLWIGDVGQDLWEEINFQPASSAGGENYGWRCYEGNHAYNTSGCQSADGMTFPVAEFKHSNADGCSVTGGMVYRGCEFPALYGHYLFTDYCSGKIWSVIPDGDEAWIMTELADLHNYQFSSFGENAAGELFLTGLGSGIIYKITSNSEASFFSVSPSGCEGEADGAATIHIPGRGQEPLAVSWSDGSSDIDRTNLAAGSYQATVTLGNGCELSQTVEVDFLFPAPEIPEITVSLENELIATPGYAGYQWLFNGSLILDANQNSYKPQDSGIFSVLVVDANGCQAISEGIEVQIADASSIPGIEWVKVSPNPFSNILWIELLTNQSLNLRLQLVDIQGKVHFQESLNLSGSLDKTLDLNDLAPGIYQLIFKTEKGEWVKKVVKQ